MSKATILTVDDDPMVLRAITRDLRARYGSDFRIVKAASGAQALAVLTELALRLRPVALIATDQRMPGMTGTEMLRQARQHAPDAKLLLLTAYADTDVAIKAINDIGLDYYLLKPWDPPAERLYPVIDDLLGDWQRAHPQETGDVRVVDHRWSERGHEIKTFLTRNYVPYRWVDADQDDGHRLQELADAGNDDLPLVFVPDAEVLRSPSTRDLAGALGLRTRALQPLYDLCIVGGGPAGLAAAVYGASEGLRTVVVEIGDTGAGMSPETEAHAFDPFYTTKGVGEGEGTGLGLDISRRIVDRHKDDISIQTRPGETVLRVRLPARGRRHRPRGASTGRALNPTCMSAVQITRCLESRSAR
jgi:thioredoxin reductase (NADPH)